MRRYICQFDFHPMNAEKPRISATIITLNEELDLPRCLEALRWVDEIVVVDTNSTDRTAEIARSFGAKVVQEPWRGYGAQKNFAMDQTTGDWVLNVDADEVITPALKEEILKEVTSSHAAVGYDVARKTWFQGRWILHGGWYPNYVTRLCRRGQGRWSEPHVHEALQITGECRPLREPLLHYTFRDIADQVTTNVKYARNGARELALKGCKPSLALLLIKPLGKFIETYFLKRGFLDGLPGFVISINAAHSMFMKYAFLYENLRGEKDPSR